MYFHLILVLCVALTGAKPSDSSKNLPKPKDMATLGMVDGEVDGNTTTITIRLDRKPGWDAIPPIESHGSFLQIVLPETIVPEPGKFFDGGSQLVPKIAVFQLTPQNAGIRLFVNGDAAIAQSVLRSAVLGRRVIISFDQSKIDAAKAKLAQTDKNHRETKKVADSSREKPDAVAEFEDQVPEFIDGFAKVESATSVIARTEVKRDLPPPALVLKRENSLKDVDGEFSQTNQDTPIEKNGHITTSKIMAERNSDKINTEAKDLGTSVSKLKLENITDHNLNQLAPKENGLREKLIQVTAFSGVMFGLLLITFACRSVIRRRVRSALGQETVDMKMIANLPLAARQKLSLVQVGDERILVGVTPEHVSFIANLSKSQHAVGFGKILSHTEIEGVTTQEKPILPMAPAPRPKLKEIPGNDELSLSEVIVPREPPATKMVAPRPPVSPRDDSKRGVTNRVNIAVGDDGAREVNPVKKQVNSPRKKASSAQVDDNKPASQEAVDDVTKMIRDKLRQLKSI